MIIDAHAHISTTDYGSVELYVQQLQESGIDQGLVVPGGMMDVRKMTEYIIGHAKPENLLPNNLYVQKSCQKHPSTLYRLYCVNPHEPTELGALDKALQEGARGLKLSPLTHQFSFSSKAILALARCCEEHGCPIYSNVVYNPGASTASLVALARRCPRTNFIIGHMGFGPADQTALEAAMKLDNIFLETSIGCHLHIKEAVKKAGPGKIIFGSEFPLSNPKLELQQILLLNLSDEANDKILGGNIRGLLKINL